MISLERKKNVMISRIDRRGFSCYAKGVVRILGSEGRRN